MPEREGSPGSRRPPRAEDAPGASVFFRHGGVTLLRPAGGAARRAEVQLNLTPMLAIKAGDGGGGGGHGLFDLARVLALFSKAVVLPTGAWSPAVATNVAAAVLRELQLEDAEIGGVDGAVATLCDALRAEHCRLEVLGCVRSVRARTRVLTGLGWIPTSLAHRHSSSA